MVSDGRSTRACDAQVAVAFGVEPVGLDYSIWSGLGSLAG